jgi:hypothetical protein
MRPRHVLKRVFQSALDSGGLSDITHPMDVIPTGIIRIIGRPIIASATARIMGITAAGFIMRAIAIGAEPRNICGELAGNLSRQLILFLKAMSFC